MLANVVAVNTVKLWLLFFIVVRNRSSNEGVHGESFQSDDERLMYGIV